MNRLREWFVVPCLLAALMATGGSAAPLDEFYKLEDQMVSAHEAYSLALEASETNGKASKKLPFDSRPGILKKMDTLIDQTHGEEEGAPIAIGAFFWSWNFDLDLDNLFGRFEDIVKHYPDNSGLDDLVAQAVDAAIALEEVDQWAGVLDTLSRTAKEKSAKIGALNSLSQLQIRANRPAKAKSALKRLISLKPDEDVVQLANGYLYEIDHLQVGMPAPDFTTKGLDGKDVSLKSFRGRAVLLNFWASW